MYFIFKGFDITSLLVLSVLGFSILEPMLCVTVRASLQRCNTHAHRPASGWGTRGEGKGAADRDLAEWKSVTGK